jgi:hypothetical protein
MNFFCRKIVFLALVFLVTSGLLGKAKAQVASFRLISDTTCNGTVLLHLVSQQVPTINALTIAIPYDTLFLNFDTIFRRHPRLSNGSFNPRNPARGMVFSWYVIDSVNFGSDTLLSFRFRALPNSGGVFNFDPNFFFCGLNNIPVTVSRLGCFWRSQGTEPPVATAPPLALGLSSRTFSFPYRPGYCTDTMLFQWSRSSLFPSIATVSHYAGRSQRMPGNYSATFLGFNVAAGDSILFWRWAAILRGDTTYGPFSRLVLPPCNTQNIPAIGTSGPTSFCQNGYATLSVPLQPFWTYQWYNGNVLIGGAVSNAYTASVSGNYSVQIMDELGCRGATQPVGVEVWPNPSPSISPSGNLAICQGTPIVLSVQGFAGSTYQWFYNNNLVSNATSNAFTATQTGAYTVREISIHGCSSLSSPVQVSVRPIVNTSLTATICQGQGYAFGSQTLTATGTYSRTVPSANGCDSVITLTLTVSPNSTTSMSASLCQGQSFAFGTQTLTAAGTYSRVVPAANGCDSVISLTLTVRPNRTASLSATICQGQSYDFGTQTLTVTGNYTRTIPAANGCDSSITVTLTVRPNSTASLSATICQGQSYVFGTQNLTTSGNYTRTIPAVNGCDSLITLTLTVRPNSASVILAGICQGQSYVFGNQTLTSAGNYTRTIPASNGCDSVVTLNLSVSPNSSSAISVTLCEGQSYSFGAQILNTAGTYTRTLVASNGCDSVITLNLDLVSGGSSSTSAWICQGQGYNFGSQNLTSSGLYSRVVPAANGCDSVITLTLTVRPNSTSAVSAGICQGQSFAFGTQNLSTAGNYMRTIPAANGCDSVITLTLTVSPNSTTSLSATICQGQSYAFGTQTLTAAGNYSLMVPAANGCDSVITLALTVRPNSTATLSAGICEGQSYVFGTQTLSVAGNYTRIIPAANGCDSVITLGLSVGTANITTITASICFGQTYLFGGNLLSLSGQYTDTILVSGSLCDSIVRLQLTVLGSLSQVITATICQGQSYLFGSQTLTSAGNYTRTVPASNGCDSVVTLNLSVSPNSSSAISVTLCEGQSYSFGAQILNTAGTYTRTLVASNGCDSVITLNLDLVSGGSSSTSAWICQGQGYNFGSQNLTSSGLYSRVVPAANGCDSVITLTLTVRPNSTSAVSAGICQGQSFAFGTQNLSTAGNYMRTIPAANGCDSVITLTLTVSPNSTTSLSATICQGQSYAFGTQTLTAAGNYSLMVPAANGCDSVITLALTVRPNSTASLSAGICEGQSYVFGTQTLSVAGNYTRIIPAANGCDSVIALTLTVRPNSTASLSTTICQGQSYVFGNQNLTTAGNYSRTIPALNGCDSVINLNLTVRPNSSSAISASVCQGQSYAFGSQTLNVPGTYTRTLVAANGCDSVITLNLSFRSNSTTTIQDSICFGTFYLFGAQVLTNSGIYTQSQPSANGCDSLTVLSLTVLPNSTASLQATICQGDYYWFGGDTLRNPGFYNDTLVALNGCDSVVILQLRVNGSPQASLVALGNTVLCQGDSVNLSAGSGLNLFYAWRRNGVIITAASSSTYQATLSGSYQVLITDTNGCSSWSNTINIQVNPRPQPVASLSGRLLSLSGGPFASYQWYRNSLAIVGATMATYTADSGGVYACLVSQGGCSALSNLLTVVGVGFDSLAQTQWWIYPNPSRGMLMLSGVAATSACLIDLWGRRVFLNVPSSSSLGDALGMGDQALDLGNVTSGVYWLELYGEQNRFLGRRKLIRIMD